ncbi:hypothetical protein KO561_14380 [Radiobacillus kanasensis]|uniref:hypothetical protein n=1 Tax=Radiobacillus kanasensis TaxID=2844358 RepID=UPI001E4CE496|nr:hypothetical protein [Radiobacillus kanasensis]UFT98378.1 hypothetical protein KO561_14380 [Radiobacillus kanasensis]
MSKKSFILLGCLGIFLIAGWFAYQKVTAETYEGMSIIPEKHEDIPLYKGLKPTRHEYVMEGNHWLDIYNFYMEELPGHGWVVQHEESALHDNDSENDDWGGFFSRWQKDDFDGELSVSASYNQHENQTEVNFDKTPTLEATTWIDKIPEQICIYKDEEMCEEVTDKSNISEIVRFVNEATDWKKEKVTPRKNTSVMKLGNLQIEILYEEDKEIYLVSEKGIKLMKPEPEFFQLINLVPGK